jgi:hypothetical protein
VQPVNIHRTMYITNCMGIGKVQTVRKHSQPHLLTRSCLQMKVPLGVAAHGPAGKAGHIIRANLTLRAPPIFHHPYGAPLWVVCKECRNSGNCVTSATISTQNSLSALRRLRWSAQYCCHRLMIGEPIGVGFWSLWTFHYKTE